MGAQGFPDPLRECVPSLNHSTTFSPYLISPCIIVLCPLSPQIVKGGVEKNKLGPVTLHWGILMGCMASWHETSQRLGVGGQGEGIIFKFKDLGWSFWLNDFLSTWS